MLTQATAQNLERKKHWADQVQLLHGCVPLFSWLDLSITELCNRSHGHPRACPFCPRFSAETYPNQNLHMSLPLAAKIATELHLLRYQGAVMLCGYGEPLLHPTLETLVSCFKGLHVEIVTNGDRLTPEKINKLYTAGATYLAVSLYDGEHQVADFHDRFALAGIERDRYTLRDRWHNEELDYGLKLTNRAGTVDAGHQPEIVADRPCYYPSYQMSVDWNGDVLLCVQDWNKKLRFGNVNHCSLVEAWTAKALHKRRMQVGQARRIESPCQGCNADGTLHGTNHYKAWIE